MPEIVLIRHAESQANVAELWQGRGDSALSSEGRRQVDALAARLEGRKFDVVVSSPLRRALDTAAALRASAVHPDEAFVELDLGEWEGLAFDVVAAHDGPALATIYRGGDDRFGGTGERLSEVAARAWPAIDMLAERIGSDGRAVVVTHGGVIDAIFSTFLPAVTRRPHRMASNTSLTHLVGRPGSWRLRRYNDSTHLHPLPAPVRHHLATGGPVLTLIRHGQTQANVDGRWQGQACWGLDDEGHSQARLLAEWYGRLDHVYSSPLGRARHTAAALARGEILVEPGLVEIGVGKWEGLNMSQVQGRWPDVVRRIFEEGVDLPRGETGETWQGMTERVVKAIHALETPEGAVTGAVTHGGVIRAFVGSLGGDGSYRMAPFDTPANTSVTHIAVTDEGPILCDYAVAPHLEGAAGR